MAFRITIYGKEMEFNNAVEAAEYIKTMDSNQSDIPQFFKADETKKNQPISFAAKHIRKEWEYDILDNYFVCLTEYKGSQEIVNIPPRVGRFPVRRVDRLAFSPSRIFSTPEQINSYISIKRIDVPEGVYVIGESAFKHCQKLESVTLPSTVCEIGDSCFNDCVSLQNITLPEGIEKIPFSCFFGCRSLKTVYIPDSVKCLDSYAFAGCTSLEKAFIPKSINCFDFTVFEQCPNLTIYTEPLSYAKLFAENHNFSIVVLDRIGIEESTFRVIWDEV